MPSQTPPTRARDRGWTLVVPVKSLARAKTRLAPTLHPDARRDLMLAMATDVLDTCCATPDVARVVVVTSDPEVAGLARSRGIGVVTDPPRAGGTDPLNAALSTALATAAGPVGVVAADLPELRPVHLSAVLAAASGHAHAVVPDHRGVGTTMAFWTGSSSPRIPRFGTDSASRHLEEGGAAPLPHVDPSGAAGRDVDTPEDLAELYIRPVGAATAAALRRVSALLPPHTRAVSATMVP